VIHGAAYRELGVEHVYELIDAASEAEVEAVVERLRSGALAGANVTIPWKRKAYACADRRSSLAERLRLQVPGANISADASLIEAWLEYWNDDDTDLGNLRTFEHWLSQVRRPHG
jgi:hypothetical protein